MSILVFLGFVLASGSDGLTLLGGLIAVSTAMHMPLHAAEVLIKD